MIDINDYTLVRKKSDHISVLKSKKNGMEILCKKTNLKKGFEEIGIYQKLNEISCNSIPRMIDYEVVQNSIFIYMTLINGYTLKEISEQKKLKNELIDHFDQIFENAINVLKSIHNAGILHRDIKPENIIIDYEKRFYLIDFSVATNKNKVLKTLGTSMYLAPEAVFRPSEIDETSDFYSLAMSFKRMIKEDLSRLPQEYLERIVNMCAIQKKNRKIFD